MHKSYKKTVAFLIVVALIGALLCIPVSAAEYYWEVSVPISKPTCTDNFAYIEVFTHNQSSGNIGGCVYLISAYGEANTIAQPRLSVQVTLNSISFYANSGYSYYIMCVDGAGSLFNTGTATSSNSVTDNYGSNICAVKYYGFTNNTANTTVNNITNCTMIYGSDNTSSRLLEDIKIILSNQNNNDVTSAINNQTQADKQNTQSQIQADKENTEAQIQADKDLYDQEKQEITDSGGQASDAADSIPNKSEGFISSLRSFVGAMSTTDTTCTITFPAITVPSVAGFPGATISEEREVDFSDAINLIPSEIMTLIQAVTTIALIVFCFKELYDTISEALTRRKSDE